MGGGSRYTCSVSGSCGGWITVYVFSEWVMWGGWITVYMFSEWVMGGGVDHSITCSVSGLWGGWITV